MINLVSRDLRHLITAPTSTMLTISLPSSLRIMNSMTTHSSVVSLETEEEKKLEEEASVVLVALDLEDRCLAMTHSLKIWE